MKYIALCLILFTSCTPERLTNFQVHTYETDDNFYNGEVLRPDSLHAYTLVVVNAIELQRCIRDAGSWNDIKKSFELNCKPLKQTTYASNNRN